MRASSSLGRRSHAPSDRGLRRDAQLEEVVRPEPPRMGRTMRGTSPRAGSWTSRGSTRWRVSRRVSKSQAPAARTFWTHCVLGPYVSAKTTPVAMVEPEDGRPVDTARAPSDMDDATETRSAAAERGSATGSGWSRDGCRPAEAGGGAASGLLQCRARVARRTAGDAPEPAPRRYSTPLARTSEHHAAMPWVHGGPDGPFRHATSCARLRERPRVSLDREERALARPGR